MTDVIDFLERVGQDSSLRHAPHSEGCDVCCGSGAFESYCLSADRFGR